MTTSTLIEFGWKEVPWVFEKDGRWMPVGPISMQERGASYKDTPRGPTLKVEIGRRGLKSLFE